MEHAQRVLAEIKTYLGKLSATQRLLIASTVVIAAMALFLVVQYAGGPSMETLPGLDGSRQSSIVMSLQASGINAKIGEGGVVVPAGQVDDALVSLTESGNLPDDTTILFNNLVGKQDWRQSREQHRQQYIFALQNELGRIIAGLNGVQSASVIIDAPERQGLGRASRDPTASVTVFTQGGRPLDQNTVDAVASLVAGSRSGLTPKNVAVIDGVTRQQRRASDEGDYATGAYLDQQSKVEKETRRKIESLLSYIPGVIVAVSAQVDVTRVSESSKRFLKTGEGTVAVPRSESNTSISRGGGGDGAEPGVRSMQGADINQASSVRSESMEQSEDSIEFDTAIGTTVTDTIDPRGMPTFLAASVNVPETYIIELMKLENPPEDGAEPENPTPAAVRTRFDDLRTQIEASVSPHLKAMGPSGVPLGGEVQVAMISNQVLMAAASGGAGGGGVLGLIGGDGGGMLGGGSVLDTALLGGLAVVALAMMVMMVRRSSKKIELPTAEELVGIPPVLDNEDDLVGEADEGEGALAGIEIGDEDMERQNMLNQIGELITSEPEKAAALLGRWMTTED